MNPRNKVGLNLAFLTSLGVHGVAFASLAGGHAAPPAREVVSEVSFQVKPLPEPTPEPELPPQPLGPERTKRTGAPPAARSRPATPIAAAAPTTSAAPPANALDLSGVTLTSDSGAGFAMPVGDGSALHGAIGFGSRRAASVSATVSVAPPVPPALVAVSDLSEHPRPPALAGLLRANYPEEARQRGLRGSARVRARIDLDGVVRLARLLSQTSSAFGAACRRTVVGSRWSAPRDKNGGAVATEIVYTCHFEVDP